MDDLLFTPAALLSVLVQIDELKDCNVGITQTVDGKLQLQVDDSFYSLEPENETTITVDEEDADAVEDANMEAYSELESAGVALEDISEEPVESGLVKEALKSMLLGGMIRLSTKLLK